MFDLAKNQKPLNRTSLSEQADKRYGVSLRCVESVPELFEFSVFSGPAPTDEFLRRFPQAFSDQMTAAKVKPEHVTAWRSLCEARQRATAAMGP